MELDRITAAAAAKAVNNREISARELTEAFLARCSSLNSTLQSLVHIFEQEALRQAEAVDSLVGQGGTSLPLAGVPVVLKDDLCYSAGPTTWGAASLKNLHPPYTAAAAQKLIDAGAIIVGKANLDPFGLGSSDASSSAGPAANPRDPARPAGDGAAAAVAAGQCLLGLSSDSGGSLRLGASHCGLFGLRPTPGLVSRHGLYTHAPSYASVALAARDAADIDLALQIISGCDSRDAATAAAKDGLPRAEGEESFRNLKIGYPKDVFALLPHHTRSALEPARERYMAAGAEFVEITLPLFREALQAYYVIACVEASSNLGRFDGIRFGPSAASAEGATLEEYYLKTRGATFNAEAKRRVIIGTHLLSKDNFEPYYRQAQKVWRLVRQSFAAALEKCSLIMLPAVLAPAEAGEETEDFLKAYQRDCFCAPVSLAGLPALCAPAGEVDNLPVGLQLVGRPFAEATLTGLAGRAALPFKYSPAGDLARKEDTHGI